MRTGQAPLVILMQSRYETALDGFIAKIQSRYSFKHANVLMKQSVVKK